MSYTRLGAYSQAIGKPPAPTESSPARRNSLVRKLTPDSRETSWIKGQQFECRLDLELRPTSLNVITVNEKTCKIWLDMDAGAADIEVADLVQNRCSGRLDLLNTACV